MSTSDVDPLIAAWLRAEAPAREPDDLLATVLSRTVRTRRRPGWLIPERWLPMSMVGTRTVAAPRVPWRLAGALALLLLALVLGTVMLAGSRPRSLPAPFGPAANGLVAYSDDGDIYTVDPMTGDARVVVSGPERDIGPVWSLDGSRFAFVRHDSEGSRLYLANADGSAVRRLTPEPAFDIESYSFSPDGREVVFVSRARSSVTIGLAAADGSGARFLELGMPALDPAFRPPDGRQIAFVGTTADPSARGLIVVGTDGTGLRRLVEPARDRSVEAVHWSPDGAHIAYALVDLTVREWTVATHVMAADGTGDRTLPSPPGALWSGTPVWSNDGSRLAMVRGYSRFDASDSTLAVVPADGSGVGVETDRDLLDRWPRGYAWAPDDSAIALVLDGPADGVRVRLVDPGTGAARPAPWSAMSAPAWQRVAPAP